MRRWYNGQWIWWILGVNAVVWLWEAIFGGINNINQSMKSKQPLTSGDYRRIAFGVVVLFIILGAFVGCSVSDNTAAIDLGSNDLSSYSADLLINIPILHNDMERYGKDLAIQQYNKDLEAPNDLTPITVVNDLAIPSCGPDKITCSFSSWIAPYSGTIAVANADICLNGIRQETTTDCQGDYGQWLTCGYQCGYWQPGVFMCVGAPIGVGTGNMSCSIRF